MGIDIEEFLKGFQIDDNEIMHILYKHKIKPRYMSNKICFGTNAQRKRFLIQMNMWESEDEKKINRCNIILHKFNECINELINNDCPDIKYIYFLQSMMY